MADTAAGGGEVYGGTTARRGGEEKPMELERTTSISRIISGMAGGEGEIRGGGEVNGDTMARRGGEEKPMKLERTTSISRSKSGMAGGEGEFRGGGEVNGHTMARRGGEERPMKLERTTSIARTKSGTAGEGKIRGGAEVYGGTMARRGGEEKSMKLERTTSIARTKSGTAGGDGEFRGGGEVNGDTMARRGGEETPPKLGRTISRTISGMAGGEGEFSYTRNSSMQAQSKNILKPILEQEIEELELFKDWSGSTIRMADFGCSVGANTLGYAEMCYQSVCRARLSNGSKFPDEVQYFFSDLPSNDFNTLFRQAEDWRKKQTSMEDFYVTAVPGSFHRRLFPKGSLHVAISTLACHWMSQVPDAVLDKSSPAYNKGRVWIDDNKNVAAVQAFTEAARQDLRNFLLSRANEVVPGGLVLFYALGRADKDHPEMQWPREGEYAGPYNKVFEATWEELVNEGIIEEERRDTFNVPIYCYSVDDVTVVVESTNAFRIKRCEMKYQTYFEPIETEQILADPKAYGRFTKKFTRSILNAIMLEHIGKEKCHQFFERLEKNAATAAREKKVLSLPLDCILTVLIRK